MTRMTCKEAREVYAGKHTCKCGRSFFFNWSYKFHKSQCWTSKDKDGKVLKEFYAMLG